MVNDEHDSCGHAERLANSGERIEGVAGGDECALQLDGCVQLSLRKSLIRDRQDSARVPIAHSASFVETARCVLDVADAVTVGEFARIDQR